jgi:penicillin amidase
MRCLLYLAAWSLSALAGAAPATDLAAQAKAARAQLSGELHIPGLRRPVSVVRDKWGVAHIYAVNQHDLFFAQGVVAAQDRLFQMEMWKRSGQGRLAEVLGPTAVERDIEARKLRYRGAMDAEYASYAPDAQSILTAFTDGINAYIRLVEAPGGPGLPIEFRLAGFHPDFWRPSDCLNRMAAFSMTGNALSELSDARTLVDLGADGAARVLDLDPVVALDPAPGLELQGLEPSMLRNLVGSDQHIEFPARSHEGSNNWAISGRLTTTGKPLLANDPHRVVALPSLRYMVHLVAPGWNVIGAGEPGLPGVALGHNESIAWGFTIFGLDQQDLYVEEIDPMDHRRYRTAAGWRNMKVEREEIAVRGAKPVVVELRYTEHGPVLWEDGSRALALRWVGAEPGTAGYLASLSIDRAHNWAEFEAAVPRWKVPSENLVYADRAGNIGEHSAGLAPIRHWTGLLPVPGAGNYEWQGFVPADALPHQLNPAAGFVATANDRMTPDGYPYPVGYEWDPGYRAQRIRDVLGGAASRQHGLSVADMEALQNDVLSLPALELQRLVRASALGGDPRVALFLAWDGRLGTTSSEAALFEVWYRDIRRGLASALYPSEPERYGQLSPRVVLRTLSHPSATVFGPEPATGRDQLLERALTAATRSLTEWLGQDPSAWSWGRLHSLRFRHPVDRQPGAAGLVDLGPVERPGDGLTVNATEAAGGESWEQADGASYREIIDAGDWDRSVGINTPGQSGQPGSRHYADLLPLWGAGEYFPLSYSRRAVARVATDRLRLLP